MLQFSALINTELVFALGEQIIAEFVHEQTGPAIARAVDETDGVRELRIEDRDAQVVRILGNPAGRRGHVGTPVARGAKGQRFIRHRMLQRQLDGVQIHALGRRAAVKPVAKNGETILRRVGANLMRAPGDWLRLQQGLTVLHRHHREARLSPLAAGQQRTAHVFLTNSHDGGDGGELFRPQGAVGAQKVFLVDAALRELRGERTIGLGRFAKDEDAARFLVEPVDDGQLGPARLAVFEPVVNAFARKRRGRVRVPARRFVHHEQMFIFPENQRSELSEPRWSWRNNHAEPANRPRHNLRLVPDA